MALLALASAQTQMEKGFRVKTLTKSGHHVQKATLNAFKWLFQL